MVAKWIAKVTYVFEKWSNLQDLKLIFMICDVWSVICVTYHRVKQKNRIEPWNLFSNLPSKGKFIYKLVPYIKKLSVFQ